MRLKNKETNVKIFFIEYVIEANIKVDQPQNSVGATACRVPKGLQRYHIFKGWVK